MKTKLMSLIIMVFLMNTGYVQDYIPFPDSNAVWSIMTFWNNPSPPPLYWDYWTDHYGITDDTIINNKVYRKLEANNDSVFYADDPSNYYKGAIRSEVETQRVYYVPFDSVNETLIYDFSIEVNDTIFIEHTSLGPAELTCVNIDSIQINEIFYQRYEIYILGCWGCYWTFWIEGIGSTKRLLDTYCPFPYGENTYNLLCFQRNDSLIYHWDNYEGCYQKLDTTTSTNENRIKESLSKNIRIVPNPVTGISAIETVFTINENCKAEILTIHGEVIRSFILKQNSKIYSSELPTGIYLIKIYDGHKIYTTKFIVK